MKRAIGVILRGKKHHYFERRVRPREICRPRFADIIVVVALLFCCFVAVCIAGISSTWNILGLYSLVLGTPINGGGRVTMGGKWARTIFFNGRHVAHGHYFEF